MIIGILSPRREVFIRILNGVVNTSRNFQLPKKFIKKTMAPRIMKLKAIILLNKISYNFDNSYPKALLIFMSLTYNYNNR